MRHHRRMWLCSALLSAGLLMAAGGACAQDVSGSPQELYLKAERADGQDALPYWEELLKQKPKAIGNGVTLETVRLNQIADMIKAAELTGENGYYAQAMTSAGELAELRNQAWSHVLLLRSQLLSGKSRAANGTYAEALAILPKLKGSEDYSLVANGLIQALLSVKDGVPVSGRPGLDKSHILAGFITTPQHRAEAWRSIAVAELLLDGDAEDKASLGGSDVTAQTALMRSRAQAALGSSLPKALRYALAVPFTRESYRDDLLLSIRQKAVQAKDYELAVRAVSGIQNDDRQGEKLRDLVKTLVEAKEITRAERIAAMVQDAKDAADAYRTLASAYLDMGYTKRAEAAGAAMLARIRDIGDEGRRADAYAMAAKFFAEMGDIEQADTLLESAAGSSRLGEVHAALAKKLAEDGKLSPAVDHFDEMGKVEDELFSRTAGSIAKAYAERGEPDAAADFLDGAEGAGGEYVRRAQVAILKAYLERGELSDAEDYLETVTDPAVKAEGAALLAKHRSETEDEGADAQFKRAVDMAQAIADPALRSQAALGVMQAMSAAGRFDDTKPLLNQMAATERTAAIGALVRGMTVHGYSKQAIAYAGKITNAAMRDATLSELALALAETQDIRASMHAAKRIAETPLRIVTFRKVAELQARNSDFYELLQTDKDQAPVFRTSQSKKEGETMVLPASLPAVKDDETLYAKFEKKTIDLVKSHTDDLIMRDAPPSDIGQRLPPLRNKERLAYDTAHVRSLIPASTRFNASRAYYQNSPYNLKFHFAAGNADFVRRQKTPVPDMISIDSGVVDLALLHDYLVQLGYGHYLERVAPRTYLLRRPIVIGRHATLVISGADTEELKLSQEAGAYIVNAGSFFAVDTKLTAWSEQKGKPAIVDKEPHVFRPFYATWSRSYTYMANTDQTAFGYTNSKSYGLTISSGPRQFEKMQSRDYKRPTGIIVDNSFRNFLYGFYSYEADNVSVVGNEYVDNVTYGVDPHDRSRWLTIAYNTAYSTHKKHGIIISREVNFSTILGNITFDNHGSGLMADRFSSGTTIYANSSFDNGGDGLTVFESSCKLIASNRFFDNKRAGLRVRNSIDVGVFFNEIHENKQAGVHGYVLDLKGDPAHAHRDFELDPYTNVTAISMVGNWIERNGVGVMGNDLSALYMRANRFQDQSPRLLRGTWELAAPRIFSSNPIEGDGLFVTNRCVSGKIAVRHHCIFRDEGYFPGDGQASLVERIDENYCAPPAPTAQSASSDEGGRG